MTQKFYVSDEDIKNYLSDITQQITVEGFNPDVIIGPGRGAFIMGVMLSHYFDKPFHGFEWQTRDHEMIQNSTRLETIFGLFKNKNILIVDDINDSGTTLLGIDEVVNDFDKSENKNKFYLHEQIKYATLFSKETSKFDKVEFTANVMEPDNDPWIVFPYEEWWK